MTQEQHNIQEGQESISGVKQATSSGIKANPKRSPVFNSKVTWLDRWLVRKMLDVVGNPAVRLSLWDSVEVTPPCDNPFAIITYCDRSALIKTILNPELNWGDLYCTGRVKFEGNLAKFMEVVYLGIRGKGKPKLFRSFFIWLGHRSIFNSMDKAKENIYHHYDIGNDFYKLWLDQAEMQYTCAYYREPEMTLEQAQVEKLHHICRKLALKSGDTVVEAGCGWGGLARFMAKHYKVNVTAYNISREQIKYARERAEQEGLDDQIEYVLEDYRNIKGEYDVFVSIGMLEHVAIQDYEELGHIVKRSLKPEGRGLIHTIGRKSEGPMNAWIERRIFPGARPPALSQMMNIFEPNELVPYDIENIRLHYSRTLEAWEERFHEHEEEITELMDEEFVKAWGLYLAGSIAAFNVGALQLYQVVFSHAVNNAVPHSRHYIYDNIDQVDSKAKLTVVPLQAEE